ncbi:MAG: fructose-bisphosphate aldolase [Patescibacteria group bacterium]|nr:fructose-bisphosphate aldolase [Patescibacteria group bacterium]
MKIKTSKLLRNDRTLMLAYDQGLEHGPSDFNLHNVDPKHILDIALQGKFNAVILQNGVAEKYYHDEYKEIPLVVKLNGKTSIPHIAPVSKQVCSVDRAIRLGADAVGYTIYDGSEQEPHIFHEFGKVVENAHDYGIPVIAWMYPRGKAVHSDTDTDILAYSARVGLELGADFVKLKYNHNAEGYKWVVKNAGRTRVIAAGGKKQAHKDFLKTCKEILSTGAAGFAIGRNIWQNPKPFGLTQALREVVFNNKKPEEVFHYIKED